MEYINSIASFDHLIKVHDIHFRRNGSYGQVNELVINLESAIPVLKDDGLRHASTIVVDTRHIHMLGPNLKGAIHRFLRDYSSVGVIVEHINDGSEYTRVEFANSFLPTGNRDERIFINTPTKVYKAHPLSLSGAETFEASVVFRDGNVTVIRRAFPQTLTDEELIRIACLVTQ